MTFTAKWTPAPCRTTEMVVLWTWHFLSPSRVLSLSINTVCISKWAPSTYICMRFRCHFLSSLFSFSGVRTSRRHHRPAAGAKRRLFPRVVFRIFRHSGAPPAPHSRLRRLPHRREGEGHQGVRVGQRQRRKQAAAAGRGRGRGERQGGRRPWRGGGAVCVRQQEAARGAFGWHLFAWDGEYLCAWYCRWIYLQLSYCFCARRSERTSTGFCARHVLVWRDSRPVFCGRAACTASRQTCCSFFVPCRHEQRKQKTKSTRRIPSHFSVGRANKDM